MGFDITRFTILMARTLDAAEMERHAELIEMTLYDYLDGSSEEGARLVDPQTVVQDIVESIAAVGTGNAPHPDHAQRLARWQGRDWAK